MAAWAAQNYIRRLAGLKAVVAALPEANAAGDIMAAADGADRAAGQAASAEDVALKRIFDDIAPPVAPQPAAAAEDGEADSDDED